MHQRIQIFHIKIRMQNENDNISLEQDDILNEVILQISQNLSKVQADNHHVMPPSDIQSFVRQELPEIEILEVPEISEPEEAEAEMGK